MFTIWVGVFFHGMHWTKHHGCMGLCLTKHFVIWEADISFIDEFYAVKKCLLTDFEAQEVLSDAYYICIASMEHLKEKQEIVQATASPGG